MRVIVSGAGAVGRHLAADLADRGHDVTLIDQDADVVEKVEQWAPGVNVIHGDACEPWVLEQADMAQAEVVVAATGDDEDNLVISLLAKQEFAVPRVVARVNHPKNEWLFNENWGVDVSVSTPHLILALTEEALSVGSLVRLLQLEKGRARLVEVTLAPDSPVIGPTIRELNVPRDSTFVAVVREEHVVVPRGDTTFQAGDEVIALVTPDSEDEIRRMLTGK
jgi:trk system potassium uptake protein TrkA